MQATASSTSTPMDMSGTIDGSTVRWVYKRHESSEDEEEEEKKKKKKKKLSWAEGAVLSLQSEWTHIPAENMIAVVAKAGERDIHTVLYVVENPAKKEPGASPVILKSFEATELPPDFVKDYSVPDTSPLQSRADESVGGTSPNLHVIVSTGSGTGMAKDVYMKLVSPLLDHFYDKTDYTLHVTTSDQDITRLTDTTLLPRANNGIRQSIILLSGDGGVVDLINGLLKHPHGPRYTKPTLSLLPLGTGNALANSSHLNLNNTLGLSTLIRGEPQNLPIFTATFSPGARLLTNEARDAVPLPQIYGRPTTFGSVVLSWGFHAGIVADSDTAEYRKHGAARFGMAAREHLAPADGGPPHAYSGIVTVKRPGALEWQPLPFTQHGYVVATLCSHFEKTFHISPASYPLRNQLFLVHFEPLSGDETMEVMKAAYSDGRHLEDDRVGYEPIAGLKIQFAEAEAKWRRVCVDGKIVRVENGGWAEVGLDGKAGSVVDLVVDVGVMERRRD